jgi:DNA processing protein
VLRGVGVLWPAVMEIVELTPQDLLGPLNEVEEKHAPTNLYAMGDHRILRNAARVSIVGSREASDDGRRRASKLSGILARRGVVVVSGLAAGIDTAAHTAAIAAGGRTAAVIGTPLDKSYPKSNTALQHRIATDHLLLSQFPLGYPVQRGNFPMRNRVMALISDATVIIEAGETSGSLSQGWEALRLGRALFIARSIIDNPALTWPAKMLGYGAYVLSDDTLDELFALLPDRAVMESAGAAAF